MQTSFSECIFQNFQMLAFPEPTYLLCEDIGINHIHNFLIGPRKVSSNLLHQPFLTSDPWVPISVQCLLPGSQFDGLVGLDDGGTYSLLNNHLLSWDVSA